MQEQWPSRMIKPEDTVFFGTITKLKEPGNIGFITSIDGEQMFVLPSCCEAFGRQIPPMGTPVKYTSRMDTRTGRARADIVEPVEHELGQELGTSVPVDAFQQAQQQLAAQGGPIDAFQQSQQQLMGPMSQQFMLPAVAPSPSAVPQSLPSGPRPQGLPDAATILGEFTGQIAEYNEAKGFGFIVCEALKAQGYRKDPFLLRSQGNGCKLGDFITFTAVLTEKRQLQSWNLVYIQDGTLEVPSASPADQMPIGAAGAGGMPQRQAIQPAKRQRTGWDADAVSPELAQERFKQMESIIQWRQSGLLNDIEFEAAKRNMGLGI